MGNEGHNIAAAVAALAQRARAIRRNVIRQARPLGQGYVGQGLQSADLFATLYFSELRGLDLPVGDPGRDRFLLSVGHYAIGLYATLVELGHLPDEELESYAAEGSALTMGTEPGEIDSVEFAGGSLGQGLGVACGAAIGLALRKAPARVFNYMSDGEVQEGSTWEAAMFAGHRKLGNLINIIDVNRTQADGPLVIEIEPLAEKFRSFGWWAMDVNANDLAALVAAFAAAAEITDRPKCLICHTQLGYGSSIVMNREAAHFVRVEPDQWEAIAAEVEMDL